MAILLLESIYMRLHNRQGERSLFTSELKGDSLSAIGDGNLVRFIRKLVEFEQDTLPLSVATPKRLSACLFSSYVLVCFIWRTAQSNECTCGISAGGGNIESRSGPSKVLQAFFTSSAPTLLQL